MIVGAVVGGGALLWGVRLLYVKLIKPRLPGSDLEAQAIATGGNQGGHDNMELQEGQS